MPSKDDVDDQNQLERSDCNLSLVTYLLLQCKLWQLWLRTALVCSQQQRVSAYVSKQRQLSYCICIGGRQPLAPRFDSSSTCTALTRSLFSTHRDEPSVAASTHQVSIPGHSSGLLHVHTNLALHAFITLSASDGTPERLFRVAGAMCMTLTALVNHLSPHLPAILGCVWPASEHRPGSPYLPLHSCDWAGGDEACSHPECH